MKLSASIVLYNTKLEEIETVIKSYNPCKERYLMLIDNSERESDDIRRLISNYKENNGIIEYIHNSKNLGYGSAHNLGIKRAIETGSKYHVVLNSDIKFEPDILNELMDYADKHEDVAYILPKVVYPNGELQYLCKLLPTPFDLIFRRFLPMVGPIKKKNDKYILKDTGYSEIMNPPCLSGCFMFMRTETLGKYNLLFDERFFMYCEDFDLIRRIHRVGKTIYYPYVTIVHNHKQESFKNKKMLKMHIKSACQYFRKYGWIVDKERKEQNIKILGEIIEICQR